MIESFASFMALAVASAVGWSIFMASLIVLHELDMRGIRWLYAAGWLATGAAGAWLGVVPVVLGEAPPWALTMLAITLSVVTWTNLHLLVIQASSPKQHATQQREQPDTEGASHA